MHESILTTYATPAPQTRHPAATPILVPILLALNLLTMGSLVFLMLGGVGRTQLESLKELNAERINIVTPEGKTVMALCNKPRIAAPVMGGKTYPVSVSDGRESMAGMIFFNEDGDEMGGLVFNSFRTASGRAAGIGHLSFDRFNDNQVLALQYIENARGVQSGLTIFDRPGDGSFKKSLDLIEEHAIATPERQREIADELAHVRPALGGERLFIGSKDNTPQLVLKDSKSRVRARLSIGADDLPRLEFLDELGQAVFTLPEKTK